MTPNRTATTKPRGPWDIEALRSTAVTFEWADEVDGVRSMYYKGEPYRGRATRVFAYCAMPTNSESMHAPFPAMVLVHGGGGTAYTEWAKLWAQRGYVAIAMDLAGRGPDGQRLIDGGPDQGGIEKFAAIRDGIENVWFYHAVANIIRATNLLTTMEQVDKNRIGITGISWGGFLTCIAAGLDDRLQAAASIYGCGHLRENSSWLGEFAALGEHHAQQWADAFDPMFYLSNATMPMLFVTGAKDPAFPLDSFQKSYRLVPRNVTLRILPDMPHSHSSGWEPIEIARFIDSHLKPTRQHAPALPQIIESSQHQSIVAVRFKSPTLICHAQLHYTTDTSPWAQRQWHALEMTITENTASIALPDDVTIRDHALAYFVNLIDEQGVIVSTPHTTATHLTATK